MSLSAIIAGGGPAGSSLSLFLAAHGWQVTQIDDHRYSDFKPGEGLVPAAKRILQDLEVWAEFEAQGHLPSYGNDSLWGSEMVQSSDFIRSIDGHGWRLDRLAFDRLLRDRAAVAGVDQVNGFVEKVAGEAGNWKVKLRGGREMSAAVLVDATGRSARIARQMGAKRMDADQLVSCWMHFAPEKEGDRYSSSLVEAVPEGWWYNALLPSGQRLVYFFSDAGSAAMKQVQNRSGFVELLQSTRLIKERLQQFGYQPVGEPRSADARSARLDQLTGSGWLAVGDAAMSFDPLSSQGILTALYGGMKAGAALVSDADDAMKVYRSAMENVWRVYLDNRLKYYQTESRWPEAEFWRRRTGVTSL